MEAGPSDYSDLLETRLQRRVKELAQNIVLLREEMEGLEMKTPGIDQVIRNYCEQRDGEGGEEVASVKESKGRIFTLDGDHNRNGYENLDDLLRESEHPEYVKIYLTPEMGNACRDHASRMTNCCFLNSSRDRVKSIPEAQMRDEIRRLHASRLRHR